MYKEKYSDTSQKSYIAILRDNFIGGIAWGVGTVIGATVVIGIIGLAVANTKKIPFVGEITQIVIEQIENGRQEFNQSN